jgi:hypothetical protein
VIFDIFVSVALLLVLCAVIYAIRRELRQSKRDKAAMLEGAGGGSHHTAARKKENH